MLCLNKYELDINVNRLLLCLHGELLATTHPVP